MKKSLFLFSLLILLCSNSAEAQSRHLIKTNILSNQLPFSEERKIYLFNQYQLITKKGFSFGLGYGKSSKSSIDSRVESWVVEFGPSDLNVDLNNSEYYQNLELAIAYDFLNKSPKSSLSFGLNPGLIKNKYDYLSRLETKNNDLSVFSNTERNTSLVYLGFNLELGFVVAKRIHLGLNAQMKIGQNNSVEAADARFEFMESNRSFGNTEFFTLAPTLGVSLGFFLNK